MREDAYISSVTSKTRTFILSMDGQMADCFSASCRSLRANTVLVANEPSAVKAPIVIVNLRNKQEVDVESA